MPVTTLLEPLSKGQIPQSVTAIPYRYRDTWAYQDTDDRYFLGTFNPITIPAHRSDHVYLVEAGDLARPDLLAYKLYQNPKLYWIILWLNGINDPFQQLYAGMALRVPTLRRLAEYGVLEE